MTGKTLEQRQKKQKRVATVCQMCVTAAATLSFCTVPALAGWRDTLKTFGANAALVFDFLRRFGAGMCVVGIAWIGLSMMLGGQKEMEEGVRRLKWIVFAFIMLMALPTIIRTGQNIFSGLAWDPADPNKLVPSVLTSAAPSATPSASPGP